MLAVIGVDSLDVLADKAVPAGILDRLTAGGAAPGLDGLPAAASETEALAELRALADTNTVAVSMIGQGYYDTLTPPVLLRNIMENPAWYTAYTPYQPEISQGRLEALLNFQTLVTDLTRLEIANASMLDEGTAAAEAMALLHRAARGSSNRLAVDSDMFAQTAAVLATRAKPLGIEIVTVDLRDGLPDGDFFGVITQLPGASGRITDWSALVAEAHDRGALVAIGADLLALTLTTPPGEIGADAAFGTTQRFGVPMGFGGPHAGYLAVHAKHARQLPGRLVGLSLDADGSPAYRLALQTREQHIRRDKATSNICTAQVLLAVMAAMYASYHGADGLTGIARRVHSHAEKIGAALGDALVHDKYFDTVLARVPGRADEVLAGAKANGVNLWRVDADHVSVACDEATTDEHVAAVLKAFGMPAADPVCAGIATRTSEFLTHPAFTQYRTETAMMRYLRTLADKDIALDRSMIPLGSCTMKLNAAAEMESVTWPEFARQHPFAPASDTPGLRRLIGDLESWLVQITGYDAVSLQPNAGSQGEYAGLLAIHEYHASRAEPHRDICLIPSSAHGTNAASAALAGMRVVVVRCLDEADRAGDVDLDDLRAKVSEHADRLSTLMITYPSTHGVYEHDIAEICAAVHDAGGQVYVDGANLNALVGLAPAGQVRRRREPSEPAQDVLYSTRRWGPGRRTGGRAVALGPVFARSPVCSGAPAWSRRFVGALRVRFHPADFVGLYQDDGRRRSARRITDRYRLGQLHRPATRRVFPGAVHGRERHGGPRVHPGPARHHQIDRRHCRRRRKALSRLRLSRAHHELPGGRHADGGAHRERDSDRSRRIL